MALIECPECKKPVSTAAHSCPACGYPVAENLTAGSETGEPQASAGEMKPLAEVRPSWWGYFWYWCFFWLIVPPIIAAFRRGSTVLRIYPNRVRLERGLLSKCYQDYNPQDIRSIDVDQSFFGRLVGIGDMTISTSATAEGSDELKSIPDPQGVRDLILAQRKK